MGDDKKDFWTLIKDKAQTIIAVSSVIGIAFTLTLNASSLWDSVVKKSTLDAHDLNTNAHPPIRQEIENCKTEVHVLAANSEELHRTQVALGAKLVRMLAAETETKAALKAAAAAYYEQEFERLVDNGLPVEKAMLEALRQPWYDRGSLIRKLGMQ